MSSWKKNSLIVFVFLMVSCVALMPFIYAKTGVLGIDAYFQYNRIYEAAMQIKEQNFSFLNLYTFQQAGRIVNQVYSPLLGYLLGGLLLLVGSWFKFQLLTFIIVFMMAGLSMYYAGKKMGFSTRLSVFLGILYLSSHAIYPFVTTGTFRSFGFAIAPLFIMPVIDLYKGNWTLKKMVWLGVLIGLLAQIQLISVLFMLPILVYPAFVGLMKSTDKLKRVGYVAVGAVTSVILSLNVLVPFLEISTNNNMLRPTKMQLQYNVLNIMNPTKMLLPDQIMAGFVVVGMVGLVVFWQKIQATTKLVLISGLVYIVLGSGITPWHIIDARIPALGSMIQMPSRIGYLGFSIVMLGVVAMYLDLATQKIHQEWMEVVAGALALLSLFVVMFSIFQPPVERVNDRERTVMQLFNVTSPNILFPKAYKDVPVPKSGKDVEKLLHSDDLGEFIYTADRITPDYLPTKVKEPRANKFYGMYKREIIWTQKNFTHTVDNQGRVKVAWQGKAGVEKPIPLFVYHRSEVIVNGKVVPKDRLKVDTMGNLIVKEQAGKNEVTVEYKMSWMSLVSIWLAIIGWLAVLWTILFSAFKRYVGKI